MQIKWYNITSSKVAWKASIFQRPCHIVELSCVNVCLYHVDGEKPKGSKPIQKQASDVKTGLHDDCYKKGLEYFECQKV